MIDPPATIIAAHQLATTECPVTAWRIVRSARDFLAGLAVFALIVLALTYAPSEQSARSPHPFAASAHAAATFQAPKLVRGWGDAGPAKAGLVFRSTDQREALLILGTAFAAILSLNLAFLRHLRRAYAN